MTEDGVPRTGGATFIALGTNLPFQDLAGSALLLRALERIEAAGVKVLRRSSFWSSPPWPAELAGQPAYVNAVAQVDPGALDAPGLFAVLAETEAQFARARRERWAARTLDLDILDFKGLIGETGGLTLPHPRMQARAFVLAPLVEIEPNWRHPVAGRTAKDLLRQLGDQQGLTKLAR